MLIGVISDSHDNLPMTEKAVKVLRDAGADMLLHCGDFISPFTLDVLTEASVPLVGVFGNNDGEKTGLTGKYPNIYEGPHRFQLQGRSIVMAHDPEILQKELSCNDDIGLCGHTHEAEIKKGPPLLVNPGETGGWLTGRCSTALVDLQELCVELIELGYQRRSFRK